jgi:transcriptional regulator with XRE-family HTH domain
MAADDSLKDLANKLRAVKVLGLATQSDLSDNTGVDQGTISRVLNGRRKRKTEALVRLENYVNMLLKTVELSGEVQEAARKFLQMGGTEAELIASIEHSAQLVLRKLR